MMGATINDEYLEGSICKNCKFRVVRTIGTDGIDFVDEDDQPIDVEDCIGFVQDFCRLLHVELDVVVLECSSFDDGKDISFSNFFITKDFLG